MIYYRATPAKPVSVPAVRAFATAALIAYPAGALLRVFSASHLTDLLGLGLIVGSLFCVLAIVSSPVQRIVGEQLDQLDEYELKLRAKAIRDAFGTFVVLVLIAIIYAAMATEAGWWTPRTYGHFDGLFWGAYLYSSVLPGALLAWRLDPAEFA